MRQVGNLQNATPEDNENEDYYGPCSGIVNRVMGMVDVDMFVRCEGGIVLFTPNTLRAKEWISATVQPDAQWFGNALVVEHGYAADLALGMYAVGLVLA